MTRDDIIARLEAASGPDRELNEAIAVLVEPGMFCRDEHGRLRKNIHGTILSPEWTLWGPPAYTASIDAALKLVPEGWKWRYSPTRHVPHAVDVMPAWDRGGYQAEVDSNPAIALCIAALKARSANETGLARC